MRRWTTTAACCLLVFDATAFSGKAVLGRRQTWVVPPIIGGALYIRGLKRTTRRMQHIDSHLHVWGTSGLARPAPPELVADPESLLSLMEEGDVSGALIVQPINYEFDHSFVADAIRKYPDKFRGMLLFDPSWSPLEMKDRIQSLVAKGFVGVRYNPYLGSGEDDAKNARLEALFEACQESKIPIGIMAFGGLLPLADNIESLTKKFPSVPVVLDHWSFPRADPAASPSPELRIDEAAWDRLLSFGASPNVYVKISALFRVSSTPPPHDDLQKRFLQLIRVFGKDRLMWGSDFPYASLQPGGYQAQLKAVKGWLSTASERKEVDDETVAAILSGTARRLFRFDDAPWW